MRLHPATTNRLKTTTPTTSKMPPKDSALASELLSDAEDSASSASVIGDSELVVVEGVLVTAGGTPCIDDAVTPITIKENCPCEGCPSGATVRQLMV